MNTKKVYELCPHCENEVKIPVSGPSHCPVCDKIILPCAMCIDCVSPCPYESEKLKLFVREKLEEVVWLDGRTCNFEEEEIEDLAYDLFSRGMLGVIHQNLVGKGIKKPQVSFLFANPNSEAGDQVRGIIKSGKLNLGTAIETQMTRMSKGLSLFPEND